MVRQLDSGLTGASKRCSSTRAKRSIRHCDTRRAPEAALDRVEVQGGVLHRRRRLPAGDAGTASG
jgi:hypothetical protein